MTARIIDGKAIAAELRTSLTARLAGLSFRPRLIVVLVGDDPASAVYVRNKDRAAREVGIEPETIRLPADTDQATVLALIARLNGDDSVDGILVQLPLPPQVRPRAVIEAIDPAKDVDGFHPLNTGRLVDGEAGIVPCTPATIVGRPVAALLLAADATVTIVHSKTRDIAQECRRADLLIAAVGRAELVRGDWIAPGATIIDVGVNRSTNGALVGDVCFPECVQTAGAITPVPGGVGPMTIACLLENTISAAVTRRGLD